MQSIAERDIEIPEHIDIYLVRGEAEPSEVNAIDYIVESARQKVAKLEQRIEDLSVADDVDELQLDLLYEELEEMETTARLDRLVALSLASGSGTPPRPTFYSQTNLVESEPDDEEDDTSSSSLAE